jgi:hypothetical protein
MDNITLLGIFRLFILNLFFPVLASYITIEIAFHLLSDAVRGRQQSIS